MQLAPFVFVFVLVFRKLQIIFYAFYTKFSTTLARALALALALAGEPLLLLFLDSVLVDVVIVVVAGSAYRNNAVTSLIKFQEPVVVAETQCSRLAKGIFWPGQRMSSLSTTAAHCL